MSDIAHRLINPPWMSRIPTWQQKWLELFPEDARECPVCSYQCMCGHAERVEFLDGRTPNGYVCWKCKQPVVLRLEHMNRHLDPFKRQNQAKKRVVQRFFDLNFPKGRFIPDIEDEP